MKKTITCILILFQIIMLAGCSGSKMNQQKNSVISDEFSKTINNYYYEDNESTRISIYSYSSEISPVLTLSLQNLFEKHDITIDNMTSKNNMFYYSIVKSIYDKKNYVDVKQLTKDSSQYDFYLAFKISSLTKDKECFLKIKELYDKYNPKVEMFSESIYEKINSSYQGIKDSSLDEKVIAGIKEYAGGADYDFDGLIDLNACLSYIDYFEIDINKDILRKIFNILSNYDNEMYIMSQGEIIASQYMDSLSILKKQLVHENLNGTFFEKYLYENTKCYQPINYEIVSARNFALYITALYFDKNEVDDILYKQLLSVSEDIRNNISKEDYASIFYYNYICNKLNIKDTIKIENNDQNINLNNVKKYYLHKLNNEAFEQEDIKNNDILYQLMYLDTCKDKKIIIDDIKNIDIYSYKNETDFPVYLNLYVSILTNNDLITNTAKEEITALISNKKNIYGYSGFDKNYDFEASCYYVNILNMIAGGYESGLR